jgi:tryptophanyl-tRNA synthetase
VANKKGRVFSGARPTGRQHLGNYLGAIKNYVALQEEYDCVYCIVDLHALTTLEDFHLLRENTAEMALDWLAAGIRPEETILFVQSHVPQVTELHTILSMFTPLGKLTDLPTFKEKARMQPHNINYGLVGYPVLMAADIALYKANVVPVGIDQESHLEFTREVVRSFNFRTGKPVLIEPQMKTTNYPKVIGTDGVQRTHRNIPGRPEVCNVFTLHHSFTPEADVERIAADCRSAKLGCVDDKKCLAANINSHLAEFRDKRAELAKNPDYVRDVLTDGAKRARVIADQTMAEVRAAIGLP